jgi:hypothetical protein
MPTSMVENHTTPNASEATAASGSASAPQIEADRRRHLEFDSSIKSRKASFEQLVEALFGCQEGSTPDPVDQLVYLRYLPKIQEAFEIQHGHITGLFYARHFHGAVVRTEKAMYVVCDEQPRLEAMDLLRRCDDLNEQANEFLRAWSFSACIGQLYGMCTNLLALLDAAAGNEPGIEVRYAHATEGYASDMAKIEAYLHRSARTQGEFQYCLGMLIGLALIAAVATVIWLFLDQINLLPSLLVASIAGSSGAVVSVMTRLSNGSLKVAYEQGITRVQVVGAFRPAIGAVFALVIGAAAISGFIPVQLPTDTLKQTYFLVVLGFIAGFSERFAQDMLLTTGRRLSAGGGHDDDSDGTDNLSSEPSAPMTAPVRRPRGRVVHRQDDVAGKE